MKDLDRYLQEQRDRRERDAKRFRESNEDLCMLCGAEGPDMRSFFFRYFWNFGDTNGDDVVDVSGVEELNFNGYYIRTCKSCRSEFIGLLETWIQEMKERRGLPKDEDGCLEELNEDANIPIRVNGNIQMITEAEWYRRKRETDS